jgi:hypothetical protein
MVFFVVMLVPFIVLHLIQMMRNNNNRRPPYPANFDSPDFIYGRQRPGFMSKLIWYNDHGDSDLDDYPGLLVFPNRYRPPVAGPVPVPVIVAPSPPVMAAAAAAPDDDDEPIILALLPVAAVAANVIGDRMVLAASPFASSAVSCPIESIKKLFAWYVVVPRPP